MNKDVIYIEPEDDITDIIAKIEKSKEKIVALVPPKKAGVFRSVVNIKLIHKAGKTAEKSIVLVTTDPSIVKLAAATKLPVTKDLQTAPAVPTEDIEDPDLVSKEELIEESDGTVETEEDVEELDGDDKKDEENAEDTEDTEEEEEKDEEEKPKTKGKDKSGKKNPVAKSANKFIAWIQGHKTLAILCGVGVLLLILFLIWALVIAPAVKVTVGIRTTSNNFSEAVTFTTKLDEEDAAKGKFYLEEKKIETSEKVEFEATGKKNVGEKATGNVVVYAFFKNKGTVQVSGGSSFTFNGLEYVSGDTMSLSWDGVTAGDCENNGEASAITSGCLIYGRIDVTAAEPGSKYNVAPSNSGWNTTAPVGVYSDKPMEGGTDKEITVVQKSDIEKAKESLGETSLEDNKNKLLENIGDDVIVIESSLKQKVSEAESTPKVGEEVTEETKPTIKVTTTTSLYVIDKTKVEEFITEKANLKDDQKIYEMKDPFVENFSETENGYTGKLKTSYLTGPKLTASSIADLIKGKGLGDAQHLLKDIDGVTEVRMDASVPWVTVVPNDTNRITINLEIKDQNGNKVEQKTDGDTAEEPKKEDDKDADKSADENSEKTDEKSDKK